MSYHFKSALTDFRVFFTFFSSLFSDFTVSPCAVAFLVSCCSVFFCRLSAARRVPSFRSTERRTFCAAATLAAGGALRVDVSAAAAPRLAVDRLVLAVFLTPDGFDPDFGRRATETGAFPTVDDRLSLLLLDPRFFGVVFGAAICGSIHFDVWII